MYKAVVRLRINSSFDRIPTDSDASIMTSGLLGGQYIGITPGGAEDYLKQGDRIEFVQDAFVLENLINQLASTFLRRDQGSAEGGPGRQPGQGAGGGAEAMKRRVKVMTQVATLILAASLPLFAFGVRAAEEAAQLGPQELVTKVAQDTLRDLDAHRSEYKQNPKRVRELVDKNMLPHFDTAYAAQLVLAKNWRTATPEQRKRFVEAFYQSLLQNYGDALLEFTPDRLKILPFQGKPDDAVATVRSEVRRDNGQRVPVNYSLRKTADGWKAYDVQIEGVSYVKSFRTDFGSEIQQRGLDPVIQRLEQQVASGTVQKPTAKPGADKQTATEQKQ